MKCKYLNNPLSNNILYNNDCVRCVYLMKCIEKIEKTKLNKIEDSFNIIINEIRASDLYNSTKIFLIKATSDFKEFFTKIYLNEFGEILK